MHNLYLAFIAFLISHTAMAQQLFPVKSDNPEWEVCWAQWGTDINGNWIPYYSYINYELGDSVQLGDHIYHELLESGSNTQDFFRRDGDRVYHIDYDYPYERLLYDFSAQAGDTLLVSSTSGSNPGTVWGIGHTLAIIDSVDTLSFSGVPHRVQYLRIDRRPDEEVLISNFDTTIIYIDWGSYNVTYPMIWIEGVGALEHPFYAFDECVLWDGCEYSYSLTQLETTLDTVFRNEVTCSSTLSVPTIEKRERIAVYPNPATEEFTVLMPTDIQGDLPVRIWSVDGQLVHLTTISSRQEKIKLPNLPVGIYVLQVGAFPVERLIVSGSNLH